MHDQDTKVLLLDDEDDDMVFYTDLETGKVINEYKPDSANKVTDICPESKHADLTQNPVFLGMGHRNLYKMDPRIGNKSKTADIATIKKIYAKDNKFTCITSNESGNFATGSETGDIRLYKTMGQNAKTKYPGLGEPILAIDCTKDGKWLLATCKNYLILLPT